MQVTTIGVDLAKNVFHVHGITKDGSVALNRPLRRAQMLTFFCQLVPMPDRNGSVRIKPLLGS
jgi:transposase